MIFLKTIFFLTSINYIFYSFGFFLLRFFKNDKHKIISIFYGISIIAFLTNILYFFLGLNIQTILIINLVILFNCVKIYLSLAESFPPWSLVPNCPFGRSKFILLLPTKF